MSINFRPHDVIESVDVTSESGLPGLNGLGSESDLNGLNGLNKLGSESSQEHTLSRSDLWKLDSIKILSLRTMCDFNMNCGSMYQ